MFPGITDEIRRENLSKPCGASGLVEFERWLNFIDRSGKSFRYERLKDEFMINRQGPGPFCCRTHVAMRAAIDPAGSPDARIHP